MRFLRFVWKLFVLASVFGIAYIVGREHSFEEEELWNEENEDKNGEKETKKEDQIIDGAEKEVEFSIKNAKAAKVSIVGDFNDWNKDSNPLVKDGDTWKTKISLKPGKHEYQFVIDNTDWVVDPENSVSLKNKFEGMNSVINVD